MAIAQFIQKVEMKGMQLPTGKIASIFPEKSTKVTRDFFFSKIRMK